jgi:predicted TIM-barrel fold metal-dependent hydrolase
MDTLDKLTEGLDRVTIIDAHSHIMPENAQIASHRDALSVYGQYVRFPMFASGLLQQDWNRIHDPEIPLRARWALLKPHVSGIRHTSFARVARTVLKHFWGVDELTDSNVEEISARVAESNQVGLYRRVLVEHSRIFRVFDQDSGHNGHDSAEDLAAFDGQDLLLPVVALIDVVPGTEEVVHNLAGTDGLQSLPVYLQWATARLQALARRGAIGFKTFSLAETPIDYREAARELDDLRRKNLRLQLVHASHLRSYIQDELLQVAARLGLPVAVHTGFHNFNEYHPANFYPVILRHPAVHFDLFHFGFPYGRDLIGMAVTCPNTSLNLCWAHSTNAAMMAQGLDECIDILGSDKIIGFGSDVRWMVEKIYGHATLARWNIARVLAGRVDSGWMDFDEAMQLGQQWLFENPARIYNICKKSNSPARTNE